MSETNKPATSEQTTEIVADVVENQAAAQAAEEPVVEETKINFADKSLEDIIMMFRQLGASVDRMTRSKEAEAIKSHFYKLLSKVKAESEELSDKFDAVEEQFKGLYADYKKERAEFNKQQDAERGDNLARKQAVLDELKNLVEAQEDVNTSFPKLREIQAKWREIGPVPAQNYRDINDSYQFFVEKFYDMVKINRDLRDLDFRKNLEAKEKFCEAAEKLAENENVVNAFHELQKLHEQWKEFGPVAKEFREDIWNRFKSATAVINKKYQAHFEDIKGQQADNFAAKSKLCELVEEISAREIGSSSEWNALTKEIEDIQVKWRGIGFASKKENQKVYDRFRAACDKFFERKRDYYAQYKDSMNENLEKKLNIIEQAEALKTSVEWKKATDQFLSLQKQWKEIGAVPRKKSEQLWKRFRAACDEFFAERDKNAKPENDFYANLKGKKKLIEEILAYELKGGEADTEAAKGFAERWQAIGFVPFKEKENIGKAFKDAMAKFPSVQRTGRGAKVLSVKDTLIQKYNALQQDITTYENNIGFFSSSKNSEPLIRQMQERINQAKEDLKELEEKIRKAEEGDA